MVLRMHSIDVRVCACFVIVALSSCKGHTVDLVFPSSLTTLPYRIMLPIESSLPLPSLRCKLMRSTQIDAAYNSHDCSHLVHIHMTEQMAGCYRPAASSRGGAAGCDQPRDPSGH